MRIVNGHDKNFPLLYGKARKMSTPLQKHLQDLKCVCGSFTDNKERKFLMAIPLDEFLKQELPPETLCSQPGCTNKVSNYEIGTKRVCSECFFDALGELIEQHPIGRLTPRSGCH